MDIEEEETALTGRENGRTHFVGWNNGRNADFKESAALIQPAAMEGQETGPSGNGSTPRLLNMKRRVYTKDSLNEAYVLQQEEPSSVKDVVKRKCLCSRERMTNALLGYIPVINVVRHYKWRENLLNDVMAGLSVAFLQLPQGLAIGLLASLPPVYGLYTTFFPVMFYMILGTSRHTSIGTNAIIALLIASIIEKQQETQNLLSNTSINTTDGSVTTVSQILDSTSKTMSNDEEIAFKVGVASAVAFLSGIYLTVAGLLNFGKITSYLSPSFVGGFTTAASFHILTSQVSKLVNVKVKAHSGVGKIVKTYIGVFENIEDANPGDVVISVISIAFLLAITIFINERYKDKLKVPVPVELLLVIISTIISHFARLEDHFGIAVVGNIPRGLPSPSLPNVNILSEIASDSFVVAILTFTVSITLAQLTAKMHSYKIDDNQEFIAYGLTNLLSSFFSCFTCCNAPPRAMILSNVGTKSILNSIFCAIFILVVLLAAGKLFFALPVAVLAAMICVAVKNLLLQITELPFLWKISKPDFVIWLLTFLVSIFMDLDYGIIVGVIVSILTVIIKSQVASGLLGAISTTEDLILINGNRIGVKRSKYFSIFHFPGQVYFASAEKFREELFSKVIDPEYILNALAKKNEVAVNNEMALGESEKYPDHPKYIILECSAITYMDIAGATMLKTVADLYNKAGITLLLTNCPNYSLSMLEKTGYFQNRSRDTIYCDIYDAVNFVQEIHMVHSNNDQML